MEMRDVLEDLEALSTDAVSGCWDRRWRSARETEDWGEGGEFDFVRRREDLRRGRGLIWGSRFVGIAWQVVGGGEREQGEARLGKERGAI